MQGGAARRLEGTTDAEEEENKWRCYSVTRVTWVSLKGAGCSAERGEVGAITRSHPTTSSSVSLPVPILSQGRDEGL